MLQTMLEEGVIEPSESPWDSPVVLVKKKDGTTRRTVDDILDKLAGAKFFSLT